MSDPAAPDLEKLATLDLAPEYVLAYIPPQVWTPGPFPVLWTLLTTGEWETCERAADHRPPLHALVTPGRRDTPAQLLAAWARDKLGYPVALEPDSAALRAGRRLVRRHREPFYYVRRNT